MAIVIKNEWQNYIQDIEPFGERLMVLTLRGPLPIRFVCIYSPPANHPEEEKRAHHKHAQHHIAQHNHNTITYV